jgi:hypothetical protein
VDRGDCARRAEPFGDRARLRRVLGKADDHRLTAPARAFGYPTSSRSRGVIFVTGSYERGPAG